MRKILCVFISILMLIAMSSCGSVEGGVSHTSSENDEVKVSYVAEFYDNHGGQWLSVEGTSFSINPNKVKEYSYSSDGAWVSSWTTASVMSITIDNQHIETCGSTVIFYDSSLEKLNLEIPDDIILSQGNEAIIKAPYDGYNYFEDTWGLKWWYWSEKQANSTPASRLVIIQSQEGDPICMFAGENVKWSVSRNLPKTTELEIDGKVVYIHRSNFLIIDTSIFE